MVQSPVAADAQAISAEFSISQDQITRPLKASPRPVLTDGFKRSFHHQSMYGIQHSQLRLPLQINQQAVHQTAWTDHHSGTATDAAQDGHFVSFSLLSEHFVVQTTASTQDDAGLVRLPDP
jgi:hypothetical protein